MTTMKSTENKRNVLSILSLFKHRYPTAGVIPNHSLGLNPAGLLTNVIFSLIMLSCSCFSVIYEIQRRILLV